MFRKTKFFLLAYLVVITGAVSMTLAANVVNSNQKGGFPGSFQPRITGIRVGDRGDVGAPGYRSADYYCDMFLLADGHTTVFAPGTLPGQKDYLFFVMTGTYVNTVSKSNPSGGATSGMVVLVSSGPDTNGIWKLDFAPGYGYSLWVGDGSSSGDGHSCDTQGSVFRSPILHNWCPEIPAGGTQDSTFDLTYVGVGSVVIDPTNLGPRELLAIYNGNNNCIGHNGPPTGGAKDIMSGYYATTAVATSDHYGKFWPIYRTGFEISTDNALLGPNAPEGAFDYDVCRSCLEKRCTRPDHGHYGRYPVLTPSFTLEQAVASGNRLAVTIGSQEPSAFVDDVHACLMCEEGKLDIYLYTLQGSSCDQTYCPLSQHGSRGTIRVARAKLNGGTAPLKFMWWYGHPDSVKYDNYVNGTYEASFDLQIEKLGGTEIPFTNAGTGHDAGGLNSPIFPMDDNLSSRNYSTCQYGGVGGNYDQRQSMGSISYVPAAKQYLLTFLCASPSDPALGIPQGGFDDANPQDGAAIFYSTLDADLYALSHQDKWSPPKEVKGSWEPFTPTTPVCMDTSTNKLVACSDKCSNCFSPSAAQCVETLDEQGKKGGCTLDRYAGFYPSFMSTVINKDGRSNPLHYNPGYLSKTGYIFSMAGCLGPKCTTHRVYNSRQFWIDVE